MEKVVLKATRRAITGKQVSALRRAGQLPAVIYGRHTEPISIALDAHGAGLALGRVGSSSLISVEVDGKEYPALVRERQRDFIRGTLKHVDFLAVSLTESLRAEVRIELTGVSPAAKDLNAVLVTGLHSVSVECLPTDLPDRIVVDISGLREVGDGIHVRDLEVSEKVRILDDPDEMVVVATYAKQEVVEAVAQPLEGVVAPEAEAEEPELSVERGKKEDEGTEEGAPSEEKKK
ncbi:MAG TPA: 50S ribosomal protein L25 [Anaerolineales bacterium]|nr:50S ribosomal protein L25 [Anaerolineales bacterium]